MATKKMHPKLEEAIRRYEELQTARFRDLQTALGEKAPAGIGFLTVVSTRKQTGEILGIYHGDNVVVKTGRQALAHLIAGDAVNNHKVVAMQFGDGAGLVSVNDTGVFGAIIPMAGGAQSKPVVVDFPDSGGDDMKVRFTATVNADEGNGGGVQVYQEAVLLKGNGAIFSHKTTGTITKDNTVVLTAAWTYIF